MQKLCCVRTRQQFSASLVHFLSRSPPFLNQFSSIFGGNCITLIDEKSIKVGGTQLITTLDGYSVPLLIRDGLAYATSLGRPTDQDMDTYPHVFFTSPDEWDPSVLDHDPPHLDGLDPVKYLTSLLVTPCLMLMEILMNALLPTSTSSWMHLQEIGDHTHQPPLFPQSISIKVHPKFECPTPILCMDIPIQHQGHFQCHHQAWNCSTYPGLHQEAF